MAASKLQENEIVMNSWMVYWQQTANSSLAIVLVITGSLGAFVFSLVSHRTDDDLNLYWSSKYPIVMWVEMIIGICAFGPISSLVFGSVPEWLAAVRIIGSLQFKHVVAGAVGRSSAAEEGEDDI
eukprot:gnl/TRDRNA2_/TRDRNA2_155771_c2_seq1.p1 gnl/TRDRNA2_/TRDRNA2_155771_c2~~gnl/TRDRNA2_/TRDRNA2_155771_c2_seq1.p1  ORF type:complete len:144 (+),score=25.02 gnl/TRDRNA2_/TRDRNA2_155771_c2_seq1:59-433(+)